MAFPVKCCRSTPRCRDCPARRPSDPATLTIAAELIALKRPATADLPGHLVGIPRCLHKYEPLFRRADAEQTPLAAEAQPVSSALPS